MSSFYTAPKLDELDLPPGKRVRLHRLLYDYGPGNGKLLILPIDQGVEHGPVDFFANPESKFPRYQFTLAKEGGYSAIALHWGLARKYLHEFAGEVPVILKLNGKSNVPPDDKPISTCHATVEDAVYLGADAVGYTLYFGSSRQDEDIIQLGEVRQECERLGMPLIIWAYPRGRFIEEKGGRDSFYAIDYAARFAEELGADIIKVNFPKLNPEKDKLSPKPYCELTQPDREGGPISRKEALEQIVRSAGRCFVIMSGGSKRSDEELLKDVEEALQAGVTGFIFGRNMWQRPLNEALKMTERIKALLAKY